MLNSLNLMMGKVPGKSSTNNFVQAFSGWQLSWHGLISNQRGEWWLIAQSILIAGHLLPAWPNPETPEFIWPDPIRYLGYSIFLLGMLLISTSFFHLGPSLSPLPDPKPGAALITKGAYKRCRHPLYQALEISSFGVMLILGSLLHLFLFISLCCILFGKAHREEKKLRVVHPKYLSYIAQTPAIFPHIPFFDWRS